MKIVEIHLYYLHRVDFGVLWKSCETIICLGTHLRTCSGTSKNVHYYEFNRDPRQDEIEVELVPDNNISKSKGGRLISSNMSKGGLTMFSMNVDFEYLHV